MRAFVIVVLLMTQLVSFAQPPESRFVEVSGAGEVQVDPDIIFLSIELREYKKENATVTVEQMDQQLNGILRDLRIRPENLTLNASSGTQSDPGRRNPTASGAKRYTLKLEDTGVVSPLLTSLTQANITGVSVTDATHSDIEKFIREASVKAVKDAREKAMVLAGAADARVGKVLQIREVEGGASSAQGRPSQVNARSANIDRVSQTGKADPDPIRLVYHVVVRFMLE